MLLKNLVKNFRIAFQCKYQCVLIIYHFKMYGLNLLLVCKPKVWKSGQESFVISFQIIDIARELPVLFQKPLLFVF